MDGDCGLDGMDTGCSDVAGLCGFGNDMGWDGINSIDLLEGGRRELQIETGVSDNGNIFVVLVTLHFYADVKKIHEGAVSDLKLLKLPPILVTQTSIDQTYPEILPLKSVGGGASGGELPDGFAPDKKGETVVFRFFYQIPKREWGPLSKPTRDRDAHVYLDITGVTWTLKEGVSHTRLYIRVVPQTSWNSFARVWCRITTSVDAHRKAAEALSRMMYDALSRYALSAVAAEPAEPTEPAPPVASPVAIPSDPEPPATPALSLPQAIAVQTFAASVPSVDAFHAGPEPQEMVTVRLNLPRRKS